MMKTPRFGLAALIVAALLAAAVAGCSSNKSSTSTLSSSASSSATSSKSSSAPAQPSDYTGLLIKETDISAGGEPFIAMAPTPNPDGKPGVAGEFHNQSGTRVIGDTILILPDASAAATALEDAKGALGTTVTGNPQPAAVGTGGTMVSGTSPDGAKAVTVLLFTEGKAFTTLEFDSAPDDPVPPDGVIDIGQKQDAAIKNGLPG
jgi:hypothetical protein